MAQATIGIESARSYPATFSSSLIAAMRAESKTAYVWAAARLVLGITFFWAFIDKVFGLGFATEPEGAWINGGSPTFGFLNFASAGPFAEFYQWIAGHPVVDTLFMVGLAAVGAAMLLGIGVRIAGYSGALIYLLMWSSHLPPEHNPVLDEHIVGAMLMLGLTLVHAGRALGLGGWWAARDVVRRYPVLE
jgi:thiosulfate dehydrogenase [quinone] large subunit